MKTIYDVPIILRREIEALMVKPFIDAFEKELGHEKTYEIIKYLNQIKFLYNSEKTNCIYNQENYQQLKCTCLRPASKCADL